MPDFQFESGGDELSTVPKASGWFYCKEINYRGDCKYNPAGDNVYFFEVHNLVFTCSMSS